MVSTAYSEAATEVLAILDNTEIEAVNKIPKKFIEFLTQNCSKTYEPNFDNSKSIKELNLKSKTQALLGLIYLKYWADEEGKEKFNKKIKANEEKYQREIIEKYNTDNLFKKKEKVVVQENTEEVGLPAVQNKSFVQKIVEKIKGIFRR
jgi:hypothetical protein